MTPLSRKILKRSCKLQHLKRLWREELTKEGAKIVKKVLKKIIKIPSHLVLVQFFGSQTQAGWQCRSKGNISGGARKC